MLQHELLVVEDGGTAAGNDDETFTSKRKVYGLAPGTERIAHAHCGELQTKVPTNHRFRGARAGELVLQGIAFACVQQLGVFRSVALKSGYRHFQYLLKHFSTEARVKNLKSALCLRV